MEYESYFKALQKAQEAQSELQQVMLQMAMKTKNVYASSQRPYHLETKSITGPIKTYATLDEMAYDTGISKSELEQHINGNHELSIDYLVYKEDTDSKEPIKFTFENYAKGLFDTPKGIDKSDTKTELKPVTNIHAVKYKEVIVKEDGMKPATFKTIKDAADYIGVDRSTLSKRLHASNLEAEVDQYYVTAIPDISEETVDLP